jgi:hypothetical protein
VLRLSEAVSLSSVGCVGRIPRCPHREERTKPTSVVMLPEGLPGGATAAVSDPSVDRPRLGSSIPSSWFWAAARFPRVPFSDSPRLGPRRSWVVAYYLLGFDSPVSLTRRVVGLCWPHRGTDLGLFGESVLTSCSLLRLAAPVSSSRLPRSYQAYFPRSVPTLRKHHPI